MERETFLSSVYLVIYDETGKILLQRRQGTKLWPGFLALPAGHIDKGENAYEAVIREAKEELDIVIEVEDIIDTFVVNRRNKSLIPYYDVYFVIASYRGLIKMNEPKKCAELIWCDPSSFPDDMIPFEKEAIDNNRKGIKFSVTFADNEEQVERHSDLTDIEQEEVAADKENGEPNYKFGERVKNVFHQKKVMYQAEKDKAEKVKKKDIEIKAEEQARGYIENLIFPSIEEVITKSQVPIHPQAIFIVEDAFVSSYCSFFCGILDSDGWCQDSRYPSVRKNSIKMDWNTIEAMEKIAHEYGLLFKCEEIGVQKYSNSFWVNVS